MRNRYYRVVVASTEGGLYNAAPSAEKWIILGNTVRPFMGLDSDDDGSLGNIGRLHVEKKGWVALAYIEM